MDPTVKDCRALLGMPNQAAHAPHSHPAIRRHPHRLVAVTAIFNPHRYHSRYRLYRTFAEQMKDAGVELITVEVAFGNRDFEVTDCDNRHHIQLRSCEEIWQKERAINIGIQRALQMYPGARQFAWIDADVTFLRGDIVNETLHKLEHHPVVQMFGQCTFLGPNEESLWMCDSFGKTYRGNMICALAEGASGPQKRGGHPGLAWAFRRETLDQMGGLLDFGIAGSGDLHMAESWTKEKLFLGHDGVMTDPYKRMLKVWADRAYAVVQKNIGYVEGLCAHHWHGKSEQRGYKSRWKILVQHKFDPYTDLVQDAQGLWQFAKHKRDLAMALRDSLSRRNEDSIDC